MVKKGRWIYDTEDTIRYFDVTVGKVYELEEDGSHYAFRDDSGIHRWGAKIFFEVVEEPKEHNHYFIDVGEFYDSETGKCEIDVYVILEKFGITNPCLQHIAKKALATGKRGHKNYERDLQDIIDTAEREKVIHSNRK